VTSIPEAPLYPNNIVFASGPLLRQSPAQYVTQPSTNAAYSASPNPTFFFSQPSQNQVGTSQQGQVFRIVSENPSSPQNFVAFSRTPSQQAIQLPAEQSQSAPRNFVTFSRTPAQQFVQVPAEPVQSATPNFVTFSRNPTQQVVAEPLQSAPRNFVTFSRTPAQQYIQATPEPVQPASRTFITLTRTPQQAQQRGTVARTVLIPAQATEQVQPQFGERNVVIPANEAAPQTPGPRTVIFFPAQQTGSQEGAQADQSPKTINRPRTVLLARPVEQPQPSGKIQQPLSSQFFTRSFGNAGAVTYFVHPLSAPAGQGAPDPET